MFEDDAVIKHGNWCLKNMIGAAAAERLPIPAESILIYAAHETEVIAIMDAQRKFLKESQNA